tara:strand:- start:18070 stop:19257 length:1188 start_codon:yes stop_codon:yes gene_type:complete
VFIPKFDDIIVFDIETTIRAEKPHFGGTPNCPDNEVVAYGYMHLKKGHKTPHVTTDFSKNMGLMFQDIREGAEVVVVGHNIAFDLSYLFRDYGLENRFVPKNMVFWDTMKFHYMDTGRKVAYPSLEVTAQAHEIEFEKDTEVSERFKLGIGADKIDRDILAKYLAQDVLVTYRIFNKQIKKCLEQGGAYTNYMLEMMQGIGATTCMSLHGMPFDTASAKVEVDRLEMKIDTTLHKLKLKYGDYNYNSPAQVKALLWGGDIKQECIEDKLDENGKVVRYKSGKRKGKIVKRKVTRALTLEPMVNKSIARKIPSKDAAAPTLERLRKITDINTSIHNFCKLLLRVRKTTKAINTYYKPYIEYAIDNKIHPSYNHCSTGTGRLSSSKPNMQNISNKGE